MARIIFLTDFSEAYARGLLLGIARYAHDSGQAWSLCRLPLSIRDKSGIEAVIDWAQRTRADAVIGQFYNTDNVELFARQRQHRRRPGFQNPILDHSQYHGPPLPGRDRWARNTS